MNSFLTAQFLRLHRALPEEVRRQARQSYTLFQKDPSHPSLRFRQVHPTRPIFSARVGLNYRVVGLRDGDAVFWYCGSHADYGHLLRQ